MRRMGLCIGLKADKVAEYKRLHAAVWPGVLATIAACQIRNFSIFLKEPENLLFGYWEYLGKDFEADMAALGAKDVTKRWLSLTDPCQQPMATARQGEWWSFLQSVFHLD